MPLVDWSD